MSSHDLSSKFDELVSKYMTLKKQVFEDIMRDKEHRDKYSKYFGKSVYYDGAYWYINNYGTAHKYIQGGKAWQDKSKSCPQTISGSVDLTDFKTGPDMVALQACSVAGNNIMNESTGEIAWVDTDGNKHVYSNDVYNNRPPICNKEPKTLSSVEYNAIPEGPPMTKNDFCFTANIEKDDYKKLIELNAEIMNVAKELTNQLPKLREADINKESRVEKERERLLEKIKLMEQEELDINKRIDRLNTISKEGQDYQTENDMYNTTTIMYMLSSVLLAYMASRLI
jgi:hypothetical protein